jgi:hypothetical protein
MWLKILTFGDDTSSQACDAQRDEIVERQFRINEVAG